MIIVHTTETNQNVFLNLVIDNGVAFPTTPAPVPGQVFYRTDLKDIYAFDGTAWSNLNIAQIAAASIPLSKLATDPLARANHTGTQLASTISDLLTAIQAAKLNQFAAPNGPVNFANQVLQNLGNASSDTDALSLGQAKALLYGQLFQRTARVAATGNTNIANPGTNVFDGVTVAVGEVIFLGFQTDATQNGDYVFNGSASPMTRTVDMSGTSVKGGLTVYVNEGSTWADHSFTLTTNDPITVGTTALTFRDNGVSAVYTVSATGGLNLAGNVFSVKLPANSGLVSNASGLSVDPTIVTRRFQSGLLGGAATFIVTHNLNNQFVRTIVYQQRSSVWTEVQARVEATDANNVTVKFSVAPAAGTVRIEVHG